MNSNMAEDRIRTKMEQLDTLQAGIVYGKEDAWDKLQARLDAKPERRIVPWYKITAAAAALLLMAGVGRYYLTNSGAAQGMRTAYTGVVYNASHITLPNVTAIYSTTPMVQDTYNRIIVTTAPIYPAPQPQVMHDEPSPIVIAQEEYISPAPVQPLPAPAPKMKVVHINELNQQGENNEHYAWEEKNPFPHVLFRMKVVHINDLGRPLTQEEYMRNSERAAVWRLPFGRKNSPYNNTGEQPRNLFRINLSPNRNNEKTTLYSGDDMDITDQGPIVY